MERVLKNLQDTKEFAKEFLQMIKNSPERRNVVLLQGELGVGKTTFSQFLLEEIGAEGPFTSPTFVIMKKYKIKDNSNDLPVEDEKQGLSRQLVNFSPRNIYHLDCYRVGNESILDLGWEEIIADKRNLILVEWPEKISQIWPEKYWLLKFKYGKIDKANERIIKIIEK